MKFVFLFSVQLLSEIFLIIRRIQRDIVIKVRRSSCKVPAVLVRFDLRFEFSKHVRKILEGRARETDSRTDRHTEGQTR